jgi:hypothetical protein
MLKKRAPVVTDAGLQQIDDLERDIIQAQDEKVLLGVSAGEVERERPSVVQLAKAVTDRMRAEHLQRQATR